MTIDTWKNKELEGDVEKNTDFDPWALPELNIATVKWSALTTGGKVKRVLFTWIGKPVVLLGLLYLFICSLGLLSSAFRLLGGKAAGEALAEHSLLSNPVCGLMIGVLVTVLVQSSSTSTSIIITMAASGVLSGRMAVPILMGANIGTTVTNTIVALGQAMDRNEFRRAFAAATVHDMFNWATVLIMLPLEAVFHILFRLTDLIVESLNIQENKEGADIAILNALTKPFTKVIVQVDKSVIKDTAAGEDVSNRRVLKRQCSDKSVTLTRMEWTLIDPVNGTINSSNDTLINTVNNTINSFNETLNDSFNVPKNVSSLEEYHPKFRCKTLFSQLPESVGDGAAGAILLVLSLLILCLCLFFIVKVLHSLLKGQVATVCRKVINASFPGVFSYFTGYVAIVVGALLTFVVQSSSIFTSVLTPLAGIGVLTLDRMYPLTLGSNIGTTTTGMLAALAQEAPLVKFKLGLQLAFCHLFFNISGILLWYPIPLLRIPIPMAKALGNTTAKYRWFAIFYLLLMFFLVPGLVFGLSMAGWPVLLGVGGPLLILFLLVLLINLLQHKTPRCLPERLRTWNWLPLWMHSFKPLDNQMNRLFRLCGCKCCNVLSQSDESTSDSEADSQDIKIVTEGHIIDNDKITMSNGGLDNKGYVSDPSDFKTRL